MIHLDAVVMLHIGGKTMKNYKVRILSFLLAVFICGTVPAEMPGPSVSDKTADMRFAETKEDAGKYDKFSTGRLILKATKSGMRFTRFHPVSVLEEPQKTYYLQFKSPEDAYNAWSSLRKLSYVVSVEPDPALTIDASETGDSAPDYSGQSSGINSWGVEKMKADQLANYIKSKTSKTIKVAVIDTGVSKHPFLKGRILQGKYITEFAKDSGDEAGHGTYAAGTIVDCTPGLNVKIFPIRITDAIGESNQDAMVQAFSYAAQAKADVIYFGLSVRLYGVHGTDLEKQIKEAVKNGTVVVVRAGNEGKNTAGSCPADLYTAGVIVVGSVDKNLKRTSESNFGKSLDLVAPGVDIKTCYHQGGTIQWSGTAAAASHIAAAAAMARLLYPSYTPAQIEDLLKKSAQDLGRTGEDLYYGAGFPDLSMLIPENERTPISGMKLVPAVLTLREGMKYQNFSVKIEPSSAADQTLQWSSSDPGVVKVNAKTGAICAVGTGTAVIMAKAYNNISTTCTVHVVKRTNNIRLALKLPPQSCAEMLELNSNGAWTVNKPLPYPGRTWVSSGKNKVSLSYYNKDVSVNGAVNIVIKKGPYYYSKLKIGALRSTVDQALKSIGFHIESTTRNNSSGTIQILYQLKLKKILAEFKNNKCINWSYSYR